MSEQGNVQKLYADFCRFLRNVGSNGFYSFFQKAVRTSPSTLSIFEKYVERRVDLAWVEAMEKTIVPLDAIIRKPNSFIKREEDIIPIAQAHGIGPESVRHLAQHTSLISSVKNGQVTPARILNVTKDDSLETYENRFIYTLIRQASYFLDKRMNVLMKDSKVADQFDYHVDGNCSVGADKITYNFNMHLETPHEEVDEKELINADVSTMTPLQRIERLRKIFYTFQGSSFFRALSGSPDVRPPLVMTNVLKKNPNFIVAVALWNFISSYDKKGYTTEDVEAYRAPSEDDKNELYALILLQYTMMKKHNLEATFEEVPEAAAVQKQEEHIDQKTVAPTLIRRSIDDLCDTFDLSIDEVRRVYEKELQKKQKKRESEFTKARAVFERALKIEKENDRLAEIERNRRLVDEMQNVLELAKQDESMLKQNLSEAGRISRYRYSFKARLIQGGEPIQSYYTELKNHILSYQKVKAHMSWGYERFNSGSNPIVKINGRAKALNLFLALDAKQFAEGKYRLTDLSEEGKKVDYPSKFRVTSERALKFAKELIDIRMAELGLVQGEIPTVDYRMPMMTDEEMLRNDPPLIKLEAGDISPIDRMKKEAEDAAAAEAEKLVASEAENEAEETGEDGEEEEIVVSEEGIVRRYRYSFRARLIQGRDPIQSYYTELKNHILSYKKAKNRMSWGYERFYTGRLPIVKINGRGKGLNLFLPLNPEQFADGKYRVADLRKEGKETEYSSKFRIHSERALRYAKELIDLRMTELGLVQGEIPAVDYHEPFRTREELMEMDPPQIKLVENGKIVATQSTEAAEAIPAEAPATEELPTAEESVAAFQPAPVVSEPLDGAEEASETLDNGEYTGNELGRISRYRYSFRARLVQGGEPIQTYYTQLKNHILSYQKVKAHMSWGYERFNSGKNAIVKMNGRAKALTLFLALNPDDFADSKYRLGDLRGTGKSVDFAAKFRVQSDRSLKYAIELIDIRMNELGLVQGEVPTVDYHLPDMTDEEMLNADPPLIKLDASEALYSGARPTSAEETAEDGFVEDTTEAEAPSIEEPTEEAAQEEIPTETAAADAEQTASSEESASSEEGEEDVVVDEFGSVIRYRYSFKARLVQGGEPLQTYYTEIKNQLLSYPKVKSHMSWGYERFNVGKNPVAKVVGRGKGLTLFLAIDPTHFDNTKYHVTDLRKEGREVDYPTKFRIHSDRGLKYAKELIDLRMNELAIPQGEIPTDDYRMEPLSREAMLAADPPLVKAEEVKAQIFSQTPAKEDGLTKVLPAVPAPSEAPKPVETVIDVPKPAPAAEEPAEKQSTESDALKAARNDGFKMLTLSILGKKAPTDEADEEEENED